MNTDDMEGFEVQKGKKGRMKDNDKFSRDCCHKTLFSCSALHAGVCLFRDRTGVW